MSARKLNDIVNRSKAIIFSTQSEIEDMIVIQFGIAFTEKNHFALIGVIGRYLSV